MDVLREASTRIAPLVSPPVRAGHTGGLAGSHHDRVSLRAGAVQPREPRLRYTCPMVTLREIRRLADTIVREYRPDKVVLFGSHADGTAGEDSDVDLLVVMPFRGNRVRKAAEILGKLGTRAAVDVVVRTPADVERRIALNDFMLKGILERGKVLHESPRP